MTITQQVMRKLGMNDLEKSMAVRDEAYHLHLIAQEDVQREKTKLLVEALEACHAANGCHNDEEAKLYDIVRNALASVKDSPVLKGER